MAATHTKYQAIFSHNLRRLMLENELTQDQLAQRAGVSQKTISTTLSNSSTINMETADKIARALRVELWTMLMPATEILGQRNQELAALVKAINQASVADRDVLLSVANKFRK
jgi:transcriptional regulator with XRE-family HTH domain